MNCPTCSTRMAVDYTYHTDRYTRKNYRCACGFRTSEVTELEPEINQARISMPYDEFVRRINGLIPREPMPMRVLLARRTIADLHPEVHG